MKRLLIGLTASSLLLFSQECVYHATQKKIHDKEDETFLQRFPKGHVIHKGGYYRFISGPYTSQELSKVLAKAKRYNHDAYADRCRYIDGEADTVATSEKTFSPTEESVQEPIQVVEAQDYSIQTTEQTIPSVQEYYGNGSVTKSEERQNESNETAQDKSTSKRVQEETNSTERIDNMIENLANVQGAYTLTFQEFMHRFFQKDFNARNLDYDRKLEEIEALIEQDGYDWNFYASASLNYGKFIDYDLTVDKELTANIGLNVDKRLFDSGLLTKNLVLGLKKRLARLNYLSAKDKIALYALDIYAQGYLNQKLKSLYKDDYETQKAMLALIQERKKAGLSSKVDVIDAKNDLMELKKTILRQLYDYLYSDFLIRNTLELHTKEPIELQEFGIAPNGEDVTKMYKEAFYNNSALNAQRMRAKVAKAELKNRENSFLPIVDLTASVAYEYKKDFAYDPAKSANGLNYNAGINVKIPIYSSENRSIYTERAKLEYLKQRNLTLQQIRDLTRDIHKTYNEIKRLQTNLDIVDKQLSLMKEKMFLVKQRYVAGLSPYRDYSDALKNYLAYMREKAILEVQILQNAALLNTLQGHHLFYGED